MKKTYKEYLRRNEKEQNELNVAFDPRQMFNLCKNFMDLHHPPHQRQNFIDPRHPCRNFMNLSHLFQNLTHATHETTYPRQSRYWQASL